MRFNPELDELIAHLKILIAAMGEVDQALVHKPSGEDGRFFAARGLFLKALDLGCTALAIVDNSPFCLDLPAKYNSISGINIITRAIYEAFLLFNYIFADSQSQNEKDLRYWIWKRVSLEEWKEMGTIIKNPAEDIDKIDKDIERATERIYNNPVFMLLSAKDRKRRLDKRKWKPAYSELGKLAGVPSLYSKHYYGDLCGFAHSSYRSIIKIREVEFSEKTISDLKTPIMFIMYSIAHFLIKYLYFWDLDASFLPEHQKAAITSVIK